jgi:cell division protein FtsI (penicillin-binding protein 3)
MTAWAGWVSGLDRVRIVALVLMALFAVLAVRTVAVAVSGAAPVAAPLSVETMRRADIVDRHGAVLATSLPAFDVWAEPRWIADPAAAAASLRTVLPSLDVEEAIARMHSSRALVRLARGLTPPQRARVHDLGLSGIVLRRSQRRFYPNVETAGRLIGRINAEGAPISGVELGLAPVLDAASAQGRAVALSIDLHVQHAVEVELGAALRRFQAKAGAGIVVDGHSGEVLALASVPLHNPNAPLSGPPPNDLATGAVFELGSTLKPFTVAAALDAGRVDPGERFDTQAPLLAAGRRITDANPADAPVDLTQALARSSNVAIGALAMRLGADAQVAMFQRLRLAAPAPLPVAGAQSFVLPAGRDDAAVAANAYGRGALFSLAALAQAYTLFTRDGALVRLRLTPALGDPAQTSPVFSAATTGSVLAMLQAAGSDEGTGAAASAIAGFAIAGKTGTSEKLIEGRYDQDRNLALFAAVFPARAPRYVLVVALDEPQRTPASGGRATGGAVAAPTAGRIAARIAPLLDGGAP